MSQSFPPPDTRLIVDSLIVVGDMHGSFNELDVEHFSAQETSLVLMTGDLGPGTKSSDVQLIRRLAQLNVPTLIMPGNNDAPHFGALSAELTYEEGRRRIIDSEAFSGVRFCGYEVHPLLLAGEEVTLISGRPCAMGGSELSFAGLLRERHRVTNLEDSIDAYKVLIDRAPDQDLIFLAHNGPTGLGGDPHSMWGRDFPLHDDAPDDWGDEDLAEALKYARKRGKNVRAVIGGHMHRGRKGDARPASAEVEGTLFVNAAVVPRITYNEDGESHHYCVLTPSTDAMEMREVWQQL